MTHSHFSNRRKLTAQRLRYRRVRNGQDRFDLADLLSLDSSFQRDGCDVFVLRRVCTLILFATCLLGRRYPAAGRSLQGLSATHSCIRNGPFRLPQETRTLLMLLPGIHRLTRRSGQSRWISWEAVIAATPSLRENPVLYFLFLNIKVAVVEYLKHSLSECCVSPFNL